MWSIQDISNQLGDALEKVRREVGSFGQYDETDNTERTSTIDAPLTDSGLILRAPDSPAQIPAAEQNPEARHAIIPAESVTILPLADQKHKSDSPTELSLPITIDFIMVEASQRRFPAERIRLDFKINDTRSQKNKVVAEPSEEEGISKLTDLQNQLEIRELQLHGLSQKIVQLQERNEFLERSALAISQEDYDSMRQSYEERLRNAEHKITNLSRERDRLLRESRDETNKDAVILEKDAIIEEVMAEGEKLSKKQLDLENAIRKKGTRVKELEGENGGLREKLTAALLSNEQLLSEKTQLVETLQETEQHQKERLEVQRVQFENLLKETTAAQAHADEAAKEAAKEGLLRRLQDMEDKNRLLMSHIEALNGQLEEQRRKAEEMEQQYKQETRVLEKRCLEVEMLHEELLAKFPEATKPVLLQLESLQREIDMKTEAWTFAERALVEQLESSEETVHTLELREQTAEQRIQELLKKNGALGLKLEDSERRVGQKHQEKVELEAKLLLAEKERGQWAVDVTKHQTEYEILQSSQRELLEKMHHDFSSERSARAAMAKELRQLQLEHQKQKADLEGERNSMNVVRPNSTNTDEISSISEGTDREFDASSSRNAVSFKHHQNERLQKQIISLEKTRDHLSTELVSMTQKAQRAESKVTEFDVVKQQLDDLHARYASAVELLGEREEQVEEVKTDLEDFKQMYRDQIAYVAEQLSGAK